MIALHIKDFIWHVLHVNKSIQFKILSQHLANLRRLLLKRHNVRKYKITLQDRINIKNIYQKMLDCGKPSFSRKDELVFFIEKSLQSLAYRNQLINDKQEPDEIEEQMHVADDMISRKARLFMYMAFSKKFMLDSYSNDKRDEMFINAIEYNLRHKKILTLKNMQIFILTYMV